MSGTKHYDVRSFACSKSIGYLLKLSHLLMHDRATTAFAAHDLSFMQWLMLMKLREGSAETASDLCKSMHYDTGAVTRLLDQLEERDLLRRERSKTDRRVVRLKLTPTGEAQLSELIPVAVDALNAALSEFSKAEFAQLNKLLNKLIASLKARESQRANNAA